MVLLIDDGKSYIRRNPGFHLVSRHMLLLYYAVSWHPYFITQIQPCCTLTRSKVLYPDMRCKIDDLDALVTTILQGLDEKVNISVHYF